MPNGTSGGVGGSEVQTRSLPDRLLGKERETHLLGRRPQRYGFTATAVRIGKLIGLRWCIFHVAQGFPSVFPVGHHFDLLTPKANADQEGNEGEVAQETAP